MIGMRPVMTSMLSMGDVQKVPVIQRAAFHCIFFNSKIFLTIGVPLRTIAKIHIVQLAEHIFYREVFFE